MRILLTNDDGIQAPGIAALYRAAAEHGEVHVVAPSKARSACGHGVTFHKSLEASPTTVNDGGGRTLFDGTALSGTPADCVKIGLTHLVPAPVDLVLSGINAGCNIGVHTLYSGTVAAAREAAMASIPAICFSQFMRMSGSVDWTRAADLAREILARLLEYSLPRGTFLNVNFPILDDERAAPLGVRVAPTLASAMLDRYTTAPDESGPRHFTVARGVAFGEVLPGTDVEALFAGYITITPMIYDPTDHGALDLWRGRLVAED
jgi:5'-nucleotidase